MLHSNTAVYKQSAFNAILFFARVFTPNYYQSVFAKEYVLNSAINQV